MFTLDLRYVYLVLFGLHKTAIIIPPTYSLKLTALLRGKKDMAISLTVFFNSMVKNYSI